MKHLKLFENFSEKENVIKEYDPRYDITYIIDTNKVPEAGDEVVDEDGDIYDWDCVTGGGDNIVGVVIKEIEGDPYNLSKSKSLKKGSVTKDDDKLPNTNFNLVKKPYLINIPNVPKPELECVKEITLKNSYHEPIHIKVGDEIILNNYLYGKNDIGNFSIESINGKELKSSSARPTTWISIEDLTDNFRLIEK